MRRTKVRTHPRRTKNKKIMVEEHDRTLNKPFNPMPKDTFHLPIETATLVPETNKTQKPIKTEEFKKRTIETENKLTKLFGGFTRTRTIGGYKLDKGKNKGKTVREKVNKVTCFAERTKFLKHRKEFETYLQKKGKEWGQESIGLEYEGDLYYIPPLEDKNKKKN